MQYISPELSTHLFVYFLNRSKMKSAGRNAIRQNFPELVRNIDSGRVLDYLYKDGLSDRMYVKVIAYS